jgi:hypothetical protein
MIAWGIRNILSGSFGICFSIPESLTLLRSQQGRIYMMQQVNQGDSTLYSSPQVFSQIIFE